MPVDKFGRMSDLKTKDTGVSLTYINNNYVRSNGETPLTGSLDMRGNTLYNVADPVNPQDVVTKVYVDNTKGSGVIGRKTKDGVSIKENLDFLGKQKIKNLPDPVNDHDAATKEYVDTTTTPFLKLDQTKYNTKGDIDMGGQFTVLNVKTPIDDNHIVDKKYVDEMDNLNSAFAFKNGSYYAKGGIIMRKNKLGGLREPLQDGEAATKKYVDDLQTQNVDEKGNIKFGRSINLDRNRIFSMKEPTKPSEGANKKYVDDTINKRLQEEKDNFLPQDPATKEYVDEAIKQVAGGDILVSKEGVFIKANGHYRATAPLDIDNHKIENLPDPVDEKDAANKKYIDGIIENLTLKQGLIRENGGFNLVDSYINMNFNSIRNVGFPNHNEDAVPRSFVDSMIKEVEEKINKRKHLIAIHSSYTGPLIKNKEQFTFGGNDIKNEYTGFLMPHSGRFKKIKMKTSITKKNFEDVILKKNRADVDFIGSGFFAFTKNHYNEQLKKNQGLILGSILCYDAYNLYVKGNPDAGSFSLKEEFYGLDFCFEDDLPIGPGYNFLKEGDIINVVSLIDLDLTKYGLDDPNANTYHVTILIELDPL